jgi:hypothetical protein
VGDRGNVVVVTRDYETKKESGRVYLYSHWGGSELPQTLQNALKRNVRWNDGAYLTRIIFCQMLAELSGYDAEETLRESETGFGISPDLGDGEYPVLVVDPDLGLVSLEDYPNHPAPKNSARSFEEYCALDMSEDGWEALGVSFA